MMKNYNIEVDKVLFALNNIIESDIKKPLIFPSGPLMQKHHYSIKTMKCSEHISLQYHTAHISPFQTALFSTAAA